MTEPHIAITALEDAIDSIMEDRRRERRLRGMANRQGLALMKSRRDGTFMVIDPNLNTIVAGDTNNGYGMDLDDVEEYLNPDAHRVTFPKQEAAERDQS